MFRFDYLGELSQFVRRSFSEVISPSEDQPAFGAFVLGAWLDAVEIDLNPGLTPWTMKGNISHEFLRGTDRRVVLRGTIPYGKRRGKDLLP
jgi:hypothetical protein